MYVEGWLQSSDMQLWSRILSEYGAPRSKYNSTSNLVCYPTTQSLSSSFENSSIYLEKYHSHALPQIQSCCCKNQQSMEAKQQWSTSILTILLAAFSYFSSPLTQATIGIIAEPKMALPQTKIRPLHKPNAWQMTLGTFVSHSNVFIFLPFGQFLNLPEFLWHLMIVLLPAGGSGSNLHLPQPPANVKVQWWWCWWW